MYKKIVNKFLIVVILLTFLISTLIFALIYYGTGHLVSGNSVIELPVDNIIFHQERGGSNIQLHGDSIILTTELIQKYYPKILQKDDSGCDGLFFCTKYEFYEKTFFKWNPIGHFEVVEYHNKNDIYSAAQNNDNFSIEYNVKKNKIVFNIFFDPNNDNELSICRLVNNSPINIEHIGGHLSCSYPHLSCDITIYIGTYEIPKAGYFNERRNYKPIIYSKKFKVIRAVD
jgi:hypothetical protein